MRDRIGVGWNKVAGVTLGSVACGWVGPFSSKASCSNFMGILRILMRCSVRSLFTHCCPAKVDFFHRYIDKSLRNLSSCKAC